MIRLDERSSAHLNLIRGLAALAVMAGHVRGLFFVDYPKLPAPSYLDSLLYALTGFGHQAVMVFFVLSGFLISSSVFATLARWSWNKYLVNRLCRLYVVLVPALLLTAALDYVACRQPDGSKYFDRPIPHFNPEPLADHENLRVFVGNLFFLQTIEVPTFGSNSPLWSLANEFWYYLLFPALLVALSAAQSNNRRLAAMLAAAMIAAILPSAMLGGFLIWLMGVAIHAIPGVSRPRLRTAIQVASAALFCVSLILSRVHRVPATASDFIVGFSFACYLWSLANAGTRRSDVAPLYAHLSNRLSSCSYSLYAIHFPVVLLIRAALGGPDWTPTPGYLAAFAAVCAGVWAFAFALSRVTELHTDSLRIRILNEFDHLVGRRKTMTAAAAQQAK